MFALSMSGKVRFLLELTGKMSMKMQGSRIAYIIQMYHCAKN